MVNRPNTLQSPISPVWKISFIIYACSSGPLASRRIIKAQRFYMNSARRSCDIYVSSWITTTGREFRIEAGLASDSGDIMMYIIRPCVHIWVHLALALSHFLPFSLVYIYIYILGHSHRIYFLWRPFCL